MPLFLETATSILLKKLSLKILQYSQENTYSLSNSRRHSANADTIANVKNKIIISHQHFFADMIYSAT